MSKLNLELFIVVVYTSLVPDEIIKVVLIDARNHVRWRFVLYHEPEFVIRTDGEQMFTRRELDHNHWQ